MIAVCRVPKDMDSKVYIKMIENSRAIPPQRLDELLELVPAHKNEWLEDLDTEAFEDVKMRLNDAVSDFEACGGRGVIQAEHIDQLRAESDLLEEEAKNRWLSRYLRNQLHSIVAPLYQPFESKPKGLECRDLDQKSKWLFIMAEEESPKFDGVKLLDASHICRVDMSVEMASLICEEFDGKGEWAYLYERLVSHFIDGANRITDAGDEEVVYTLINEGWSLEDIRGVLNGNG